MSFIRPEAMAFLKKWREAIFGGAFMMFNLYLMGTTHGTLSAIAFAGALIGAALFVEGMRRGRLPQDGGGVGVVEVDERQITYLAPGDRGGAVSINDLVEIKIQTTDQGPFTEDLFWHFTTLDRQVLTIPGNAENLSDLFDNLPALPGINWDAIMQANASTENAEFLVWKASPA